MMEWYWPCMKMLSCLLFVFALLMPKYTATGNRFGNATHILCIAEERQALLHFKLGIQDDDCGMLKSWHGQECCDWDGILCSNRSGHVIGLDLSNGCLHGAVSPSLVELKYLKYLDLSNNFFNHSIPSFLGSLVNLERLNLSSNEFVGEIPHQLANLSSLISLDLSGNYGGTYSNSLGWVSHLTLLRDINLGDVDLSQANDWMQVVSTLPSLRSLRMDECSLSPSVPSSLSYANSSNTLHVLSLRQNSLNDSSILHWVSNFAFLEYLDLSDNGISGSFPSIIGNMHLLSHLDLSSNDLQGVIPSSIFELNHMDYLDISNNNLQGVQFLNSSGSLCCLQILDLSYNNITSDFANIIQAFSGCALVTLDVSKNRFWGSIPDMIGAFSSLEELSLGDNQLNGTFPNHHLSNLSRLTSLDLSNNHKLVVDIGANWVAPFQLGYISLRSCKIKKPYFPKWLLNQTRLTDIDLSDTGISDTIPSSFWNSSLYGMGYLNLSNNSIHGQLPDEPQTIGTSYTNFEDAIVDLSSNYIEGVIPSFLRNASMVFLNDNWFSGSIVSFCPKSDSRLLVLDLSNNFLSGELRDCWNAFVHLEVLRLDNNNFTGKLPSLGSLNLLMYLSMRNNSFNGELQISRLPGIVGLRFLDLAHNSFTGDISTIIGNVYNRIQILDLRSNKFFGQLPLSICRLGDLQVLDLSYNQISGTIPGCIYHLQGMAINSREAHDFFGYNAHRHDVDMYYFSDMIMWKRKEQPFVKTLGLVNYMAISDNLLQGEIPSGISCLKALGSLDLARNNLSGPIPPRIGEMNSLEFLDLSRNHLSGHIPSSLADLNFLGTLDLSYNNLSGIIPTGTQLQSMNATAYAGNPGLCGPPLSECTRVDPPKGDNFPEEEKDDNMTYLGLCISVVLGFIVGFWGVCGTLVIKRSIRHAYFRYAEDIYDRLYVMVVVTIPRIWRRP